MNSDTTTQTACDIKQVIETIATRQYELEEMGDVCPREVEALATLMGTAQGALAHLKGQHEKH